MTDSLITQYTDCLAQLRTALYGLTETDLYLAPSDGRWTIRQIIHHIVDGDDLWKWCIKAALGNAQGVWVLGCVARCVGGEMGLCAPRHRTCARIA